MNSFFKSFFGALLALIFFSLLSLFILTVFLASIASSGRPEIGEKAVLVVDLDLLFSSYRRSIRIGAVKEKLGESGYQIYQDIKRVKEMVGKTQSRLPFEFTIQ
jgi:hypothetical protein